ncbi:MAG: hypothetical protein ACW98Y_18620 [Candidatus Thorarchaeota archaeon]|jgi:dolichol kinase
MVELYFGDLTTIDIFLALFTGIAGGIVLAVAYKLAESGVDHWKPRKLVHVSMGSIIAFTVHFYATLSGPSFAAGIFLTILFYAWAHKSDLITDLLVAGSRENESSLNTFASGFMGMVAFMLAFLVFFQRPTIFVAAILAVSWGDAAGEVVGRSLGGAITSKRYKKKSLEGSLGVWSVSILVVLVAIVIHSTDICPLCFLPQIVLIGFAIMLTELLSIGWTDNFFIPIVTAVLVWQFIFPGMPLFIG